MCVVRILWKKYFKGNAVTTELRIDMLTFQSGKYKEPEWLSAGSKGLIKSMLQTDPKKRITVDKLVCHPWVVLGHDGPVCKDNLLDVSEIIVILILSVFLLVCIIN
jgi:serine/threonine protein kinase